MIIEKYIVLMNKEIDGIISPRESEKLRDYLKMNPEAMKYYNDLKNSLALLNKIPENDPPENLKKSIMNSIDRNRYLQNTGKQKKMSSRAGNYLHPRFAMAIVLGIVIGIAVYPIFFTGDKNAENYNVNGTIGLVDEISEISNTAISAERVNGSVKLFKNRDSFWFDVEIFTQKNFSFNFGYDKTKFIFISLEIPDSTEIFMEREGDKISVNGKTRTHFKLNFNQVASVPSEFKIGLMVQGNEELNKLIKVK